jgi:hypothetical protein
MYQDYQIFAAPGPTFQEDIQRNFRGTQRYEWLALEKELSK